MQARRIKHRINNQQTIHGLIQTNSLNVQSHNSVFFFQNQDQQDIKKSQDQTGISDENQTNDKMASPRINQVFVQPQSEVIKIEQIVEDSQSQPDMDQKSCNNTTEFSQQVQRSNQYQVQQSQIEGKSQPQSPCIKKRRKRKTGAANTTTDQSNQESKKQVADQKKQAQQLSPKQQQNFIKSSKFRDKQDDRTVKLSTPKLTRTNNQLADPLPIQSCQSLSGIYESMNSTQRILLSSASSTRRSLRRVSNCSQDFDFASGKKPSPGFLHQQEQWVEQSQQPCSQNTSSQEQSSDYDSDQNSDDVDSEQQRSESGSGSGQLQQLKSQKQIKKQSLLLTNKEKNNTQRTQQQHSILVKTKIHNLITRPIPKGYKITCIVKLQSKYFGMITQYNLTLQQNKKHLISAKKEHFKLQSSFILSTNDKYITKRDNNNKFIGTLVGNFTGTQYDLSMINHHNDKSTSSTKQQDINDCQNEESSVKNEQKLVNKINFDRNLLGYNGVRSVSLMKLKLAQQSIRKNQRNSSQQSNRNQQLYCLTDALERNELSKVEVLHNQKPSFCKGKYKIDFKGKAKMASSKNIIFKNTQKQECLLIAKQSESQYLVEVSYPLSIFQAFGVCLANLDSKLFVK